MPFNGGGFSGGGFGRAPASGVGGVTDALTNLWNAATGPSQDPWATATSPGHAGAWGTSPGSQQAGGVVQYGNVWASNKCPSCDAAIRQLQAALGVPVDGKVGQGTADAVARVAQIAQQRGLVAEALQLARVGNSPELVAKNADWILPNVQRVLAQVNAANAQTAPTTFPAIPDGAPPPPALPPGFQVTAPGGILAALKPKLPYLIGAVVLLAGGVAVYFITTAPRGGAEE